MQRNGFTRFLSDGRLVVLLLLLIYGAVWRHFDLKDGWVDAWRHMRVAGLDPAMVDMRGMLGAFQNYRDGVPMEEIQNPSPDSNIISFTYPESWMIFAPLGLTPQSTSALTLGAFIVGVLAWLAFTGPLTLLEGVFYGLIMISPSLMLGVERGNGDLFIFLFVLAACWLVAQRSLAAQIVGNLLFLFGGVLKVYPIAGLSASLKSWRPALVAILCSLFFLTYIYFDRTDLRRVNAYTSRDTSHSFGARVFTGAEDLPASYGYAAAAIILVAAATFAWSMKPEHAELAQNRFGTAFLSCACMFLVCYLIGNNYVYRYRLFLLILPQVLIWARQKFWPAIILAASMFLTSYASNEPRLIALAEPLNWLIFGLLAYFSLGVLLHYGRAYLAAQSDGDDPEPEYLQPS